jgi:hypothetical protein
MLSWRLKATITNSLTCKSINQKDISYFNFKDNYIIYDNSYIKIVYSRQL